MKIGSVDKGHLEITFGTCDLELGDVGEPAVQGAPSPSTEAESDLFTSSGWESIDVGDGNPAAVAASGRSTSKASRRNDGSGDDTKTTSR